VTLDSGVHSEYNYSFGKNKLLPKALVPGSLEVYYSGPGLDISGPTKHVTKQTSTPYPRMNGNVFMQMSLWFQGIGEAWGNLSKNKNAQVDTIKNQLICSDGASC